jgi:simple sugar transport system permease protein
MLIPMIPDAAMGANQHLSTAVWGVFLVAVMILRRGAGRWKDRQRGRG